jgi:hypothetical protein
MERFTSASGQQKALWMKLGACSSVELAALARTFLSFQLSGAGGIIQRHADNNNLVSILPPELRNTQAEKTVRQDGLLFDRN